MKALRLLSVLLSLFTTIDLQAVSFDDGWSVTESLIRDEIIRLGGEWEGGAVPARVGFIGARFSERHFEMLEHLRPFRMLTLHTVDVGPDAMKSISKLASLEKLHIEESTLASQGSVKLSGLKMLTSLKLYECKVDPHWIGAVGEIPSLKHLSLERVDLPPETLEIVGRLRNLENLNINSSREFKAEEIEKLKAKLPRCKIEVSHRPSHP
jgi:hypothetical protein